MPVNMPFRPRYALHALLMLLALAGSFIEANQPIAAAGADISVVVTPLPADDDDQPCSGAFVTRYLPHFTSTADGVIRMFQANGSGIGAGDMDDDGDLDLVTASYDAGLLTDQGTTFLLDGGGGIVHYRNEDGRFVPTVLETEAQAMAVALQDLNGDGLLDIMVVNDFAVPDRVWLQNGAGWLPADPFAGDASTLAAWAPVMSGMDEEHAAGDPQHMENVLQIANPDADFANQAPGWGVDGTGWSWSSKFGDLDNDGYLDLHIVNGMIEERMFGHLPRHELLEENQAFRNMGGAVFEPAAQWALDSRYSGRGSEIADLDMDGDLDIAVNNLRGPAQIFENRLCAGDSLQVELRDPLSANSQAIGARLALVTGMGTLTRDVRAASGYLSGDAPRVHFGIPSGTAVERLEIYWPDGARSTLDAPAANTLLTIERMAAE